ncbi:GDSL-type esterase/lipase family protein [Rubripirellula reticaptiva]|uniref:GDSL-like Lipase/Acylhydrolase n=1 Tax=Rubripirellula reticaptiva TaxID=2528013 RepID=A0A5C6EGM4_9BACT|nr:GDSL-type esterase/lipase family protein [Rubripirellula reticaptiva]TWU48152.1 GDSL-like Lipase/Acylhydrolase [Rubripirellula reticaptiva]
MRPTLLSLMLLSVLFGGNTSAQDVATEIRFAIPDSDEGLPGAGPIRRYDWMRNIWNKRRSTFADRVEQDQGAIVFFGDSITQGWGDDFGGRFDDLDVNVANRGISGDTTRGMLLRIDDEVIALDPAAVVMLMGTNDLEEHADAETIASNVGLMVDKLNQHDPEMPIVLCLVMPSSESKSRPAAEIKIINAALADLVRGNATVTVVDTWTLFANKDGDAKKEEFPDLLHPNGAGYAKWKSALIPIFATLGFTETGDDDFQVEDGFTSLFNGHDLTGWGYRVTPQSARKGRANWIKRDPSVTWPLVEEDVAFAGQTSTPDHRYRTINGRLVVTTPPEGRKIQQLYTTEDFQGDFTLRLQFRAGVAADSGVFLRGHQLQVRDFPLAGPYKDLTNFRSGDWNDLEVIVVGDKAKCTCNGEILEAAFDVPASGSIGVEGDRGQIEYRRIRIRR